MKTQGYYSMKAMPFGELASNRNLCVTGFGADGYPSGQPATPLPAILPEVHLASEKRRSMRPRCLTGAVQHVKLQSLPDSLPATYPNRGQVELVEQFIKSHQYLENSLEPTVGSHDASYLMSKMGIEGRRMLCQLENGSSVLLVLVEKRGKEYICVLCGNSKGSRCRALGCVRACLNFRPFVCPGNQSGCNLCIDGYR